MKTAVHLKTALSRTVVSVAMAAGTLLSVAQVYAASDPASPRASIGISLNPIKMLSARNDPDNAKVGMEQGDLLVSLNKHNIYSADDARKALSAVKPGDKIDVEFVHYDKPKKSHDLRKVIVETRAFSAAENRAIAGLSLDEADRFSIADVAPDSPIAQVGAQKGDIVLAINKRRIAVNFEVRASLLLVEPGQSVDVEFIHENRSGCPAACGLSLPKSGHSV